MRASPEVIRIPDAAPPGPAGGALAAMSRGILAVLGCPDIESAAAHILGSCRELIGASAGRIAVLAPDGSARWVARIGPAGPAAPLLPGRAPAAPRMADLVVRIGPGVSENRRRDAARRIPLPRPCAAWSSFLGVPLTTGGVTEGLLLLGNKAGGFTRRDLLVAASFGALAAAAHQRCRAAETLERRVSEAGRELSRANRALARRVRAYESVRAALEREHALRGAVEDSLPTGIIACDARGRLLHVNRAFGSMVRRAPAELVGAAPPYPFWPPEERAAYLEAFAGLGRGRLPPGGFRLRFVRRGGERFDVALRVSRLRGSRGSAAGWVASVSDITGELRTEEALHRSAAELRRVSLRLFEAEEHERRRISRELHDSLGQTLSALKYRLEEARDACLRGDRAGDLCKRLERALGILGGAIEEVRAAVADLRPAILDDLGLASALRWFCRRFQEIHPGLRCTAAVRVRDGEVPAPIKTHVFRLVQEALNNVAKHSGAGRVRVRLGVSGGRLELSVEDDGRGFRPGARTRGAGLLGMRERTELSGGRFAVASRAGAGTTVRAVWPLPPAARG